MIKEPDTEQRWKMAAAALGTLTGKTPDLNGALFLIGIQELGQGVREFSKEEKQDLMHIATCRLLSAAGYYRLEGLDEAGWPHWEPVKTLPELTLKEQEQLLKMQVADYLSESGILIG